MTGVSLDQASLFAQSFEIPADCRQMLLDLQHQQAVVLQHSGTKALKGAGLRSTPCRRLRVALEPFKQFAPSAAVVLPIGEIRLGAGEQPLSIHKQFGEIGAE